MSEIRWHTGYQMVLVPGAHDVDKQLTKEIHYILKNEFKMSGVNIVTTQRDNPKTDKYHRKEQQSHVLGQFPVGEARHDSGKATLSEFTNKEAVYFITHPYNHSLNVDVETTIAQICLFGRTIIKGNYGVGQLSLVTPIGPYDLNHSFKRNRGEGLIESESLPWYLERVGKSGFNEIITITSHSSKTEEIAKDLGIYFRDIDAFRFRVPSGQLGPFCYEQPGNKRRRNDFQEQIAKMIPFVTYLKSISEQKRDNIYIAATDEGSADLARKLAFSLWDDDRHVLLIEKERAGAGKSKIIGVDTQRSTASLDELIDKTIIMPDDRRLSGGTTNDLAIDLKENYRVAKVIALIPHDMSYNANFKDHTAIDELVFLETNPNSALRGKNDRIIRLPISTTALLLAAEIYDSYIKRRQKGKIKIR